MILRRITQHVKDQNWFAVGLDFFIVVVGVFIGIQVANWNDSNANHKAYLQALERLDNEISSNLTVLEVLDKTINKELMVVQSGLDTLITCTSGQDSIEAVNAAMTETRGVRGLYVRTTALAELTTNPILLSEQSNTVRARFADLLFYHQIADETLTPFQPNPIATRPAPSSTLAIKSAEKYTGEYFGIDYEVSRYPIALNVTMNKACQDLELQKWLHSWEAWHTNVLILVSKLQHEYKETQALLRQLR